MTQQNNEAFEKWFKDKFPNAKDQERKWFTSMGWQAAKADSESILKQQQNTIAELKEQLQTELKRVSSYKNLVASLEGQVSHYSQKDYSLSKPRLDGLEQSLASEQEMNEVLTNENTELQASNKRLREALESAKPVYTTANDAQVKKGYAESGAIKHYTLEAHILHEALASTPAQSLQAHDDEVIERCAKLIEPDEKHRQDASWGYIGGEDGVELLDNAAESIRALKENQFPNSANLDVYNSVIFSDGSRGTMIMESKIVKWLCRNRAKDYFDEIVEGK